METIKIKDIRTIVTAPRNIDLVVVKVITDTPGLVGWGCATFTWRWKPACLRTRTGVVGVLATERSLDGDLFCRTAARYGRGVEVVTAAGRGFVELVEQDRESTPEAEACVGEAMEEMLRKGADQIVLGCTHYPFLMDVIQRITRDKGVEVIDPSPAVARRVESLLRASDSLANEGHRAEYEFDTFADERYRERLAQKAALSLE